MANSNLQTLKLAFLPLFLILHLHHTVTPTRALNLGVQADTGVTVVSHSPAYHSQQLLLL